MFRAEVQSRSRPDVSADALQTGTGERGDVPPRSPRRSRCVRFFRQGKACTPLLVVRPLWAALGGFRGTKEKAVGYGFVKG